MTGSNVGARCVDQTLIGALTSGFGSGWRDEHHKEHGHLERQPRPYARHEPPDGGEYEGPGGGQLAPAHGCDDHAEQKPGERPGAQELPPRQIPGSPVGRENGETDVSTSVAAERRMDPALILSRFSAQLLSRAHDRHAGQWPAGQVLDSQDFRPDAKGAFTIR